MKIKSKFALLDVETGRGGLNKMIKGGHDLAEPIEVIIRGKITRRHGSFDGVSQEFGVQVSSVEVVEE
jgi:hypothetical protein